MERVDYESLIVQELINAHNDATLDINPWYQRRSVWLPSQKAYLINTILEKKPVPSIYIRHEIDLDTERSIKEVVDGQQRIRSILEYRDNKFPVRHPRYNKKIHYSELTRNDRGAFLSTALSVGYLIGADDRDVIEIFGRINSVSKSLNPQEKRNAQYSGDFKQFCLRQAADRLPFWRSTKIFTANEISRMQEVQFISDLVINMMEGLIDYNASKIDHYYKLYDDEFSHEEELSERMELLFQTLVRISPDSFSDTIFRASQITFSLMIVLDQLRDRNIPFERVGDVIREIDREVSGYAELERLSEIQARRLQGFTGGNLHRIRARSVRHEVLCEAFS